MTRGNGFFQRRWQHHALVTAKLSDGKHLDYQISAFDDVVDLTRKALSEALADRTILGAYEDLSWNQIQTLDKMVGYANQGHNVSFGINLKDQDYKQTF